jgi:beta-N-acetylhexosaminidase
MARRNYWATLFFTLGVFTLGEAKTLHELSLEEKVGQVFMAYFEGSTFNESARQLIEEAKFGGIIYYNWSNDLSDPLQVQQLSLELQKNALEHQGLPLFIAVDQEAGLVSRLKKGFTEFPGNAALGLTHDPHLSYLSNKVMAEELHAVGINFNLAPVVDVNSNANNPIIGIRAYDSDPETVVAFAQEALKSYQETDMLCCLKHFPGHGDVTMDSHTARPVLQKPLERIKQTDLYPFTKLASQAPAIMGAHILFPNLDQDHVATLSSKISTTLLREEMGFKGLLISDSLTMAGATEGYNNLEDVFIDAFEAGNDILLIGGRSLNHKLDNESNLEEILKIHSAFLQAVRSGRVSQKRLNQSVERILEAKKSLYDPLSLSKEDLQNLRKDSSLQLAKEIAYRSVQVKTGSFISQMHSKKLLLLYPDLLESVIAASQLAHISPAIEQISFKGLSSEASESAQILEKASEYEAVILCSYNAWKAPKQQKLLQELHKKIPVILVATRDSYDQNLIESPWVSFATSSPTSISLDVVASYLLDETSPLELEGPRAEAIGQLIWKNECNNRIDQLTFWHEREPFPSMGIAHFIWPPQSYQGPFSQGRFHEVVQFIKDQGANVAPWLLESRYCPWETREAFYNDFESEKMRELRVFLTQTTAYQAQYMLIRLNRFFRAMTLAIEDKDRPRIYQRFFNVYHCPKGPYILIDYLNFKHEGTDPKERYQGQGWGLLQVLQNMENPQNPAQTASAFVKSAKQLLEQRIERSSNPELERKWQAGWWNRLSTYL